MARRAAGDRQSVLRLVNLHYAPDVASTGQHLTDLAEHLASVGMDVEVLTAQGHYVGGQVEAPRHEIRNGVRVHRLPSLGFGRRSRVGRVIDYAVFYLQVIWIVCVQSAPAGTVFLTTPPLLSVAGWLGRRLRGARYAIWSMDLHPDAEFAAGMLRPRSLLGRLLMWLNDGAYCAADFIIDLGPYMQRRILSKGVAPDRACTVPVWGATPGPVSVGCERSAGAKALRAYWGVSNQYVVMYSGNAGIVHDFDAVLRAAEQLTADPTIYFVFIGGGPRRTEIEAFVRSHEIRNFAYYPYVPRERVADTLAAGDVHLITLLPDFAGIAVPGKLYGIMAAARPALFVGPAACESADTIRGADGGVVIDPAEGDAAGRIVAAIRRWRDDPAAARAAGARAFSAYVRDYQREPNCRAFARVLSERWPDICEVTTPAEAADTAPAFAVDASPSCHSRLPEDVGTVGIV
jgi:glycosyltransferase involved in cell wall biosynthesis